MTNKLKKIEIGLLGVVEGPEEFIKNKQPSFLCIELSCGEIFQLNFGDRIPAEDVPCPCGNPEHYFVKIKKQITDTTQ